MNFRGRSIDGKIIEWNDKKGFGFISAFGGELKAFLHISAIENNNRRPKLDDEVSFEVKEDNKGRYNAFNVSIKGADLLSLTPMLGLYYLFLVAMTVVVLEAPKALLAAYVVLSVVTYGLYAIDKKSAQNGTWRIPEYTLHWISVLGGWPGALYAQNKLRHKSIKQPFKNILWLTVFFNTAAFVWTFTSSGAMFVQSVLG